MSDEFLAGSVLVLSVFLLLFSIIVFPEYLTYRKTVAMAKLGYEQFPLAGTNNTLWRRSCDEGAGLRNASR